MLSVLHPDAQGATIPWCQWNLLPGLHLEVRHPRVGAQYMRCRSEMHPTERGPAAAIGLLSATVVDLSPDTVRSAAVVFWQSCISGLAHWFAALVPPQPASLAGKVWQLCPSASGLTST